MRACAAAPGGAPGGAPGPSSPLRPPWGIWMPVTEPLLEQSHRVTLGPHLVLQEEAVPLFPGCAASGQMLKLSEPHFPDL